MSGPRVLITAPRALSVFDRYERELAAAGCQAIAAHSDERLDESQLLPLVGDIQAIVCGDDQVTPHVLDAAPGLSLIVKWGTGMDSIAVAEARRRGIAVKNSPGAFSAPVADTVMGYVLLFARQLDRMSTDMHAGLWLRRQLVALEECTLGIVGLGASGLAVARRARAFGMRVLANTVDPVASADTANGITLAALDEVLAGSDFVTLHADLRSDNRHLIGPVQLRKMRPSAVLINTARGPLVDEVALVDALRQQRIAGAALDVFEDEPLPADSPLRGMDNVYLAPHNANASGAAAERVHRNCIRYVVEALGRQRPA